MYRGEETRELIKLHKKVNNLSKEIKLQERVISNYEKELNYWIDKLESETSLVVILATLSLCSIGINILSLLGY